MSSESYDIDPAMDTLMVLIAELLRNGTLKVENVASMIRRLNLSDLPNVAQRVEQLHFSNEVDTPAKNRGAFQVIDGGAPDGGNQGT